VAVVLGAIFLGEAITLPILVAGAAIVVAVVLIVTAKPKLAVARARLPARPATLTP
jgi:drug/metabolite transporter (DMT)-like permease